MSNYTLRDAKQKYDHPTMEGSEDGYYNHLEFDINSLPEIASWQVGEEYILVVKVKQEDYRLVKDENAVKEKATFKVLEVAAYTDELAAQRDRVKEKLK